MRGLAKEYDAVAGFRIDHDVLLCLAPILESRPVEGVHMFGFKGVTPLDELEVGDARRVVLEVKSSVDAHWRDGQSVLFSTPLLLPVAVKVEVPFLVVRARVNVGSETAQLALGPHCPYHCFRGSMAEFSRTDKASFTA